MPKISVVMPAYNAEKYIAEAIDSILGQTFTDFEFIIINDCSQDQTEEIILSYDDPRIVYLKNEQNMGVAATLNKGLAIAQGEYIARMDADDISLPERFEKQTAFLDSQKDVVCCGSSILIFGEGYPRSLRTFPTDPIQAQLQLLFSPCFAHPSVMMRTGILQEHGLHYDLRWEGTEDYALWWELGKRGKLCALSECLLHYRMHPKQVTANSTERIETVFKPFAQFRLDELEISCASKDAEVLLDYTSGRLSPDQVEAFVMLMGRIMSSPRAKQLFRDKPLKKHLKRTVFGVMNNIEISKEEKAKLYTAAYKVGLNTNWWRCRDFATKVLRRFR